MKFIISLMLIGASLSACSNEPPPTIAERYPGTWHTSFSIPISKVLVKNKITSCGEYKYRPSSLNPGEYLVYCTRDGESWTSYIVWPNIGKASGPHRIESDYFN